MIALEVALKVVLRVTAVIVGLAVFALVMPRGWMVEAHRWMGLGDFPADPMAEYLARALSGFYAMMGGLLWLVSRRPRRYAAVITYIAVAWTVLALTVLSLAPRMGMPVGLVGGDTACVLVFSIAVLSIQARLKAARAA
jgi:hypothetical protein